MKVNTFYSSLLLIVLLTFSNVQLSAANRYCKASGNWSSTNTWTATSGGATAASVPTSSDSVFIERNFTVTVDADAQCLALVVKAHSSNGTSQLTINGFTLTVSGAVQIQGGSNGNRKAVLLFNSTGAALIVNGNVTIGSGGSGSTATLNMTTGGTLSLTGTLSRNTSDGVFTNGAGTINYNSSTAAQTISFTNLIYTNLSINNTHSSGATIGAAITATNVTGNINVGSGILNSNDLAITLGNSKTFTVAAGATFNGGTSTITFGTSGIANINGTFNTSNTNGFSGATNAAISSTNSPTINQGTSSTIGLSGTQNISSGTYNSLTVSGTITATGALTVSGDFTMSSGSFTGGNFTHNVTGDWNVSGGTFTNTNTTINFNGSAAQSISSTVAFNNVTISNASGVSLLSNITVNGTLSLSSGKLTLGANNLTIGTAGSISGSSTNYIVASGAGAVIQQVTAGGSKSYPVGLTSAYLPVTIALTGGSTTDNFSVNISNSVLTAGTSGAAVTSDAVNATWNISEGAAGNSNATITLQWPGSLEMTGFARGTCRLAHYTGGAWDYGTVDLAASGSDPYSVSRSGFTSFSPFSIGENIVLPVKWSFVKGTATEHGKLIEWGTASEYNNDRFEIEASRNGVDFVKVAELSSKGNQANSYSFLHTEAAADYIYYRIKQIDLDGHSEYSQTIMVKSNPIIQIYPNPAKDIIHVTGINTASTVYVKSINGERLMEFTIEPGTGINISSLPAGVYFLQIGEHHEKLIKVN